MVAKVKLKDLVEAMEFQTDESASFLNRETAEVVTIADEEFRAAEENEPTDDMPDWMQEIVGVARQVLNSEAYLQLPSKFDIHEYRIIERFCLSQRDETLREELYSGIKGRAAFRRFKELIHQHDISDEWYRYRDEALNQIAIYWCEEHSIDYISE